MIPDTESTSGVGVTNYRHDRDYDRVGRFLVEVYRPGRTLGNWLQPRWEYMHSHPNVDALDLRRIGVFEKDGRIVGVVHPEHSMAFVYFQVRPGYGAIEPAMFDYAVRSFGGRSRSLGREVLGIYVDDEDLVLRDLVEGAGFDEHPEFAEDHSRLDLAAAIPPAPLPDGYRLQSLADDNDLDRCHRVLHRGFGHEGEPDPGEVAVRRRMQSTPGYRHDLTMIAVAPNGDFASYAGMWVVAENRVGYVEPVATDPAHRRLGLGRAVVLEACRRAAAEGADVAWVGSGQQFYLDIGFRLACRSSLWIRDLR